MLFSVHNPYPDPIPNHYSYTLDTFTNDKTELALQLVTCRRLKITQRRYNHQSIALEGLKISFTVNPFKATCRIYLAPADKSLRHITEISGNLRIGCIVAWRQEHFVYSTYIYHSQLSGVGEWLGHAH